MLAGNALQANFWPPLFSLVSPPAYAVGARANPPASTLARCLAVMCLTQARWPKGCCRWCRLPNRSASVRILHTQIWEPCRTATLWQHLPHSAALHPASGVRVPATACGSCALGTSRVGRCKPVSERQSKRAPTPQA